MKYNFTDFTKVVYTINVIEVFAREKKTFLNLPSSFKDYNGILGK